MGAAPAPRRVALEVVFASRWRHLEAFLAEVVRKR